MRRTPAPKPGLRGGHWRLSGVGCSAYPKCRGTKRVPEELNEKFKALMPARAKKDVPAVEVKETCPE